MSINWYPGHMKKTKDMIESHINLVDVVIEIVDARIPYASKNPLLEKIISKKPRLIILSKSDLADDVKTAQWEQYFRSNGNEAIAISSKDVHVVDKISKKVEELFASKRQKNADKGMVERASRVMIVGIPNVGKSTLINRIAGKKVATTGDKAGVTRGKQWIRLNKDIELFDTPGVLWPKFEEEIGIMLAITGAINDNILNIDELAYHFVGLMKGYESLLADRYGLDMSGYDLSDRDDKIRLIEDIGRGRTPLGRGGSINLELASRLLISDFRQGNLGKITLESSK